MEAVSISATSANFHETTLHNIPENFIFILVHTRRSENLNLSYSRSLFHGVSCGGAYTEKLPDIFNFGYRRPILIHTFRGFQI
jgi:hypothetical protein